MKSVFLRFTATIAILVLASCAKLFPDKEKSGASPSPFGATGIPSQLRAGARTGGAQAPTVPGNPASAVPLSAFTPEEEIVFTDPDNPDAGLPELSTILANQPKKSGPWEESETIAKQRSAREGKPLLIWFTDSSRSPMCKALAEELFATPDFEKWASENIVRLRVDANVAASNYVTDRDIGLDEKETRRVNASNYVEKLKKRYKALGYPFLVFTHPGGEVMHRFRGYQRGDAAFLWGQMKHAHTVSSQTHAAWRAKLEKKGYREWSDKQDRKVFAKLTSYKDGTLTLIEPDGTRSKTHESKLSADDRRWINEQKKLRGM
ncbi:MAG: thioredoxin fold domain-containing protein [Verrucomicrobiota bacterium]